MELYYVPYRKANIEWVLDINVKAQTIKLLEVNLHILDGANVTKSTRDKHINKSLHQNCKLLAGFDSTYL